jgi:methylated-DNA-protein-cysteine methyltransferase-like protein
LRRNPVVRSSTKRTHPTPAPAKAQLSMQARMRLAIQKIPKGKVSTYGAVARAAGFPGASRQVAGVLHRSFGLPWQRVLGAGGEIKLRGDSAIEQRLRLEAEGVRFRGRRVDLKAYEFKFVLPNPARTRLKKK